MGFTKFERKIILSPIFLIIFFLILLLGNIYTNYRSVQLIPLHVSNLVRARDLYFFRNSELRANLLIEAPFKDKELTVFFADPVLTERAFFIMEKYSLNLCSQKFKDSVLKNRDVNYAKSNFEKVCHSGE